MTDLARAPPDGHTMIMGDVGSPAVKPLIVPTQLDDVNRDVVPVTMLAIPPDGPARDFEEFVAHVRHNPGRLNDSSAGIKPD